MIFKDEDRLLMLYSFLIRKIELIKFACRARQLFIRILAVVKWAATTGKVSACEVITHREKLSNNNLIRFFFV